MPGPMKTLGSARYGDLMVKGKGLWQSQTPSEFLSHIPGGFVGLSNYPGNPIFADPINGSDLYDGTLPKRYGTTKEGPKLTFTGALAIASAKDVIVCGWGDFIEDGLVITQRGLKVIGFGTSGLLRGSPLFIGTLGGDILTIKADDVEIVGLGFYQTVTAKCCISLAENPAHYWRNHIHDCGFAGEVANTWGIRAGAVAAEAPYTVVERCRFYNLTGGVRLNSSAMVVQDCHFSVPANSQGIEDVPTTSSRPDRSILRNTFKGLSDTSYGVFVSNTPNRGELLIDQNHMVGFVDNAHCCNLIGSGKAGLLGLNYNNATAMAVV